MNRLGQIAAQVCGGGGKGVSDVPMRDASYKNELQQCRQEIRSMISEKSCHPIMIRLAWHDSGTFDKNVFEWPACGGANGSIRFNQEMGHGANAGLKKALAFLKPIKDKHAQVSHADLMQMASAEAVDLASGGAVKIPMKYGRVDTAEEEQCPKEGNLPGAGAPFGDGASNAAQHLRNVFYRMGFNDQEIVALSGAHTLGRAFNDRSGTVQEKAGGDGTKYTNNTHNAGAGQGNNGMKGGKSWTQQWLKMDNDYFKEVKKAGDKDLLVLETDAALFSDGSMGQHARRYAEDQAAFFRDYAAAHKRLSELGSRFEPAHGIVLD